jgi:hypothetical protein
MILQQGLNEYHLQFLRPMVRRGVRFLVIGGQARFVHHGTRTRDLDLWVDISPQNKLALGQCLSDWKTRYPLHSMVDFSIPLPLRPGVQIKLPDADVLFLDRDGQPKELSVADGIDILTSIGNANFDEFYARAVMKPIDGQDVHFLSVGDLDAISPSTKSLSGPI